jgi:hypothetical protein
MGLNIAKPIPGTRSRERAPTGVRIATCGEWDQLTKKEMWDTIQEIRQRLGSDGTCSIISDIDALEERAKESSTDRCAKCGYTVYGCHCNPAEACTALHKHEEAEKALREAAQIVVDVYPYNVDECQKSEHGPCRECQAILNLCALLANETEVKDA